ncbi:3-methylcrotonyl-CoA carboxylase subunit alpha [Sphingomonas sp. DBB INV C78]|uniref:acetyl/propionyl/methylcrotonyl-CoA carboxylase subunit alpha n=1 Tax=Sphingomonas sp. DBB INV C78 TaxID=3349434 RepID=UPI0036D43481
MITSLLIANRGEIACRVIRTARAMGIRTVAVYSDADANALHVRQADEAVHIGPSPARESYLVGDKIIAAAKATGAEAIHPGYGFLSENAAFAQAVMDVGLVWVGPMPASITAMGLKDAAKKLMRDAGVPTTPGYLGENQDPDRLKAEADAIGYPVLIKAVAGGGGKGMRRVDAGQDFADALLSCQREAASSFGDDRVLIEKYILSPRHLEVQVFGDKHGNIVHLFERDCSLQRRHQKVIEEAPAPGMDEATREAICGAAVRAAQAVDYVGAGTIEFIADASEGLRADRIWFMEMNTRLQVEHPVTEEITGQDLVEWQLRVASGEPLPKKQDELSINGWSVEARLYAEDPAKGFLPSVGRLDYLALPNSERIETGVEERDTISPFYDPMIAKVVSWGETRKDAIAGLANACGTIECEPVKTNAWFLKRLLESGEFADGNVTTGFIGEHIDSLCEAPQPSNALLQYAADDLAFRGEHMLDKWGSPLFELTRARFGFRLNAPAARQVRMSVDSQPADVEVGDHALWYDTRRTSVQDGRKTIYFEDGAAFVVEPDRTEGKGGAGASDGSILSPMPGRIVSVDVTEGQTVTKGQKLVVLEAMKMEQALIAPFDGKVVELKAVAGAQVAEGVTLVRVEKSE